MKTTKIVIAVLLALVAALSICSCGKDDEVTAGDFSVNVIISSDEYGTLAEGVVGLDDGATALGAITKFCDSEGIEYKLDKDVTSIKALGDYKEVERQKLSYYWQYTVNGKELPGRAGENTVAEGDEIRYNYTFVPTGDFVTVSFEAEGEVIVKDTVVVFSKNDSVLDSALDALKRTDYDYDKSEDGKRLQYVDDYLAKVTPVYDDIWSFTVNGKAVAGNPAPADVPVNSNDKIVFTFIREEKVIDETNE